MRSGKRHLQLQNDIKNDHAKGVENAFPATVAGAMQILNDFKPVVTESTKQVSLGTAFAQDGKSKKQSKGRLSDEQWNALSPEAKAALVKKRKDDKAAKTASGSGDSKKSSSKKDDDDSSVSSSKTMSDLQKENKMLKRVNKKTKAALITTINEGDEDDSSLSEDGSQSFNAAMAVVQDNYSELHDGIVLAHKIPHLKLSEVILIDSQTTHDVFCNPKYVGNVRKAKKDLHLSTNGGGMRISREADVLGLYPTGYDDTVYYDRDAITNILSFKKLAKVYRITYDSDVSKTFTVHRESHGLVNLRFTMHPCGLHVLEQSMQGSTFILTVDDNKKLFTKRQIAGATEARNTYEALLCPSVEDFGQIIGSGAIRGCKLTMDDADISFKIFGPSVIKEKGSRVRQSAKKNPTSIIAVPRELIKAQEKVTLCIDFFFINQKHIFLMTYSESICFTTNTHVVGRKVKQYWSFLKDIYEMYLKRGLQIVTIRADLEFVAIQLLIDQLPTRPRLVLAAQGEHVGPIERNIRFAKEKIRSLRYMLPFKQVPKNVIIYMVFNATIVMNLFPRKGGNKYYSPQAIMSGRGVSVEDLRVPFGSYVQVTNATMPHNSLEPRTRGAIALGMMGNNTGGRVLLALDTGKLIRRSHVKVIPMTDEVIARVNYLGRGEKSLLTFQNRRGEDIGERTVNRVDTVESDVQLIEHDMLQTSDAGGGAETDLDVVDDVTGVDNPYEEYVDEWNKDVSPDGDEAIDQVYESQTGEPDTGVYEATDEAFEQEMEFEPTIVRAWRTQK